MTTERFLLSAWNWDPFALGLGAVALAWALVGWRRSRRTEAGLSSAGRRSRKAGRGPIASSAWLVLALAGLLLALVSPVGVLADGYLFSAHMVQHLLLLLIVPPLFLAGLPPDWPPALAGSTGRQRCLKRAARACAHPAFAWLAGVGAMWLWHVPALCNAAAASGAVYRFQVISLLALGMMFWAPIVGPRLDRRLPPLLGVLYLFSACSACTLLGIFLTFAPLSVCSVYLHPVDRLGIVPLIREGWGLAPAVDQQIGGLLMWVPSCLIYVAAILGLLARWYAGDEPDAAAPATTEGARLSTAQPLPEKS